MKFARMLSIFVTLALLLTAVTSLAVVPGTINYQGRLTDDAGNPVDTVVAMTFSICLDSAGIACVWGETQDSVVVTDGLFNVKLGDSTPITDDVFDGDNRWMHVKVDFQPIEPPTELLTSPYAFRVSTVDGATGGTIVGETNIVSGLRGPGDLTVSGNVAIGQGSTSELNSLKIYKIESHVDRLDGVNAIIDNTGTGGATGGWFTANENSSGGNNYGVAGTAHGSSPGAAAIGVRGAANDDDLPTGVYGLGKVDTGGDGYAIGGDFYGYNYGSGQSYGVTGWAQGSPTGSVYGGYFHTDATGTGTHYGIYAIATGEGNTWAGFFNGDVRVSGTFDNSKSGIIVDHPLDPENKYLVHSSVNSPEMLNVYCGNVTTDNEGKAVVSLPDYFEAFNENIRYQLTVIGQFAQAIISEKVSNNSFIIKTDKPNVEVSWQVTGDRKDAYAKDNPVQVEVEKSPEEKGLYLHPGSFGQNPDRSINYEQEHQLDKISLERSAD